MKDEKSWMKFRLCVMTLGICTISLAMNAASAGAKEIVDPVEVINAEGDSLNVTIDNAGVTLSGDIEVKNDSGNPLPVSGNVIVTNNSPIHVAVWPGIKVPCRSLRIW